MSEGDHKVEGESHDDQGRDDVERVESEDIDESDDEWDDEEDENEDDDEEEEASEDISCPHCESVNRCEHLIATWSGSNADWWGKLVDASKSQHRAL